MQNGCVSEHMRTSCSKTITVSVCVCVCSFHYYVAVLSVHLSHSSRMTVGASKSFELFFLNHDVCLSSCLSIYGLCEGLSQYHKVDFNTDTDDVIIMPHFMVKRKILETNFDHTVHHTVCVLLLLLVFRNSHM